MSKDKKMKTTRLDLGGKKLIEFHTSRLNKRGVLKGRNKKETQLLKDTTMFHKITKKGKIKGTVEVYDGMAHDTQTGIEFRTKPFSKDERKELITNIREFTNQTKFMAAAIGAEEAVLRSLAEFSVGIRNLNKINKNCTKIVQKEDGIRKKNKKNKEVRGSRGSWKLR